MSDNTFKIAVGETTAQCSIELNGAPLKGVRRISFELNPNDVTLLKLEIMGSIIVDGEFRDDGIIMVREEHRRRSRQSTR